MSHGIELKNCLYKAMQADLERQFETLIGSVTHSNFYFFLRFGLVDDSCRSVYLASTEFI